MMLQTVHNNSQATRASYLYCVWTPRDGNPGSPLVAIWIDSNMTAFERESCARTPEEAVELNSEEPGGCVAAVQTRLTPGLVNRSL